MRQNLALGVDRRHKANDMKLKTKYAAGMRDELEDVLGCQVEVVEDLEAKYPSKEMMTKLVRPRLSY